MNNLNFIEQLKTGDPAAFRRLVDENQDRIVNTCFGFLENRQDAEDIAQNVFIEAYQSINKFRGDSNISTWLYRIAVNKSLNHIKVQKRRRIIQSLEAIVMDHREKEIPAVTDTPESGLEKNERRGVLQKALKSLPDNQKIAITLNKYEDLSYQEVANIMGLSLSAVTALINRGKVNLQKKIRNFYKKSENTPKEN